MAIYKGGESVSSGYEIIERIDFIREQKFGFKLSDYIRKFEISRRTALRDFNFLNTYRRKPCKVKRISEGIYIYTEENLIGKKDETVQELKKAEWYLNKLIEKEVQEAEE